MLDAATERLLAGRALGGRYRIGAVIGRGGMSTVFVATDERLGREVALKIIAVRARGTADLADFRERFRREAAAAAQIPPHPNVVQVYDYGTDAELDLDYLVMERLRGRDLKQCIADGGLSVPEAVRVLTEAARGLAAGHRAGFVHRDVKPANIFLVGTDVIEGVKVLDFGIAKAIAGPDDDLTRAGAQPLSPAYASPEQLSGGGTVAPASDVFQLGLVAFELFTGDRAREAAGQPVPTDPSRALQSAGVPPHAVALIARALASDVSRRPREAAEFAAALSNAAEEEVRPAPSARAETRHAVADDDATFLDPRPVAGVPVRPPAAPRSLLAGQRLRTVAIAAGVVGLAIGAGAAIGGGGATGGGGAIGSEAEVNLALYEEAFRPLYSDAAGELLREASPLEGSDAAVAVQRVVMDLYQSLVVGDLDRHIAHYAERVSFEGRRNTRPARIRRERERLLERFEEREVTVERHAITFPEAGRARVLVDQSWSFSGGRTAWEGVTRQELLLRLDDGHWRIVGERNLEGDGWNAER
jgi:hypothetical protein